MEKRAFGNGEPLVTPLGLGTMELAQKSRPETDRLLHAALDAGIGLVDTAPCYPESEERIGHALAGRRDSFFLTTKCGCTGPYRDHPHRFDRATLLVNIDESLRRLRTDHIDLWQLHMQSSDTFPGGTGEDGEIIRTMEDVLKEGKARRIGLSFKNSFPDDPLYPAEHGFRSMQAFGHLPFFSSVQLVYGALTRTNEEAIQAAANSGKSVIVRGLLKHYFPEYATYAEKARLAELCEEGETLPQFLIRFALSTPGVTVGLAGTLNIAHLQADVAAAKRGALPTDVLEEAKRRLDAVGIRPKPFIWRTKEK